MSDGPHCMDSVVGLNSMWLHLNFDANVDVPTDKKTMTHGVSNECYRIPFVVGH